MKTYKKLKFVELRELGFWDTKRYLNISDKKFKNNIVPIQYREQKIYSHQQIYKSVLCEKLNIHRLRLEKLQQEYD